MGFKLCITSFLASIAVLAATFNVPTADAYTGEGSCFVFADFFNDPKPDAVAEGSFAYMVDGEGAIADGTMHITRFDDMMGVWMWAPPAYYGGYNWPSSPYIAQEENGGIIFDVWTGTQEQWMQYCTTALAPSATPSWSAALAEDQSEALKSSYLRLLKPFFDNLHIIISAIAFLIMTLWAIRTISFQLLGGSGDGMGGKSTPTNARDVAFAKTNKYLDSHEFANPASVWDKEYRKAKRKK